MKQILLFLFSFMLLMQGCEDVKMGPISSDSTRPGNITDVTVKNIGGGAEISYTIPPDNDLLYVKASYTIENGRKIEVKSSMYEKKLTVKGYNTLDNTKEFPIAITCVDRSDNESEPIVVMIKPEIASIQKVRNSLTIGSTWGGANYAWTNEDEEPITLIFLVDTVLTEGAGPGELIETRVLNTKLGEGSYTMRGYPDQPRDFAVLLMDNYGNKTDTIRPPSIITPLLEIKLDKTPMRVLEYGATPVEDKWDYWEGMPQFLIDDNITSNQSVVISYQSPWPRYITVSFNRLVKLSRYVMWMRDNNGSWLYEYGNPKTWVLYMRSEPLDLAQEIIEDRDGDGEPDWTNYWTKVGEYEMTKPSGLPDTQKTDDDITFARAGVNYDIPIELESVRYFRLGVTSNFGGYGWVNWLEVDFYGIEND